MSERAVKAYVLAIVKRGTEHNVAERIQKIEDITEVLVTYGMWDLVARIETESLGKLDKIITEIRQTPEIEQTSTLIGA
ncbi:Lrp/AsnC family transcriptional regulator [Candidatus Bathyarchaeota archaeon]|nr:Lrp/AsnC family transcriptional regulator [Candidatus Bathyarchaeota archaeon]